MQCYIAKLTATKLKDPGSFDIPITIGDKFTGRTLYLRASINLMTLSIYNMLGQGKPKSTSVTLQLVDGTLSYPKGVVEDVLVKVNIFLGKL